MKPKPANTLITLALTAVLALAFTGCASSPKPIAQNLKITVDKTLENASLQIDAIGANANVDIPKWESYSVTEYWQPGNTTRTNADRLTLEYGRGKSATQVIPATDAKWKRWLEQGATYVVIIADIPGISSDKTGNADPRRLILPLDANQWNKDKKEPIEILVQESGLRVLTPRATEKKGLKLF